MLCWNLIRSYTACFNVTTSMRINENKSTKNVKKIFLFRFFFIFFVLSQLLVFHIRLYRPMVIVIAMLWLTSGVVGNGRHYSVPVMWSMGVICIFLWTSVNATSLDLHCWSVTVLKIVIFIWDQMKSIPSQKKGFR